MPMSFQPLLKLLSTLAIAAWCWVVNVDDHRAASHRSCSVQCALPPSKIKCDLNVTKLIQLFGWHPSQNKLVASILNSVTTEGLPHIRLVNTEW